MGFETEPNLAALAAGRPEAFAALFDQLGPGLLRFARTYLWREADAEDVVQDLFMVLFRDRKRFERVVDLNAYTFAVLRNLSRQRLAQRASELRRLEMARAHASAKCGGDGDDQADFDALHASLAKLPVEQREIIALKIDGDLTFAQIAQVLAISANTAASRYRYAVGKLRAELKSE